ncbi:protein Lin1p [[Candida] railenensis]|uniref:Protein Lin1p n=1 Tax=[Candida] railenensis TaxID=45579 RepID=A0A9P0VZV4_9ASCO|nr:protein Lin1p [[Candida] railenensis]
MSEIEEIDVLLADDLPGNSRKKKQKQRNDIRLNYSSDSSDNLEEDEEEVDSKEPAGDDPSKENESDDMFADDNDDEEEEEEENTKHKSKIQKTKPIRHKSSDIMDMREFERNEGIDDYELENDNENEQDEDEDEEDVENEKIEYFTKAEELDSMPDSLQTRKSTWKPKIEAFNLREEADEGHFDLNGNYVKTKDEEEEAAAVNEDHWIHNTKKSDILRAKESQLARERATKEKRIKRNRTVLPTTELLSKLIEMLEPAESPLEALARLTPQKLSRNRKKKQHQEANPNKETILCITEVCDQLVNDKTIENVYEMTREEFMRLYKTESGTDFKASRAKRSREELESDHENESEQTESNSDYGEKIWEFRWIEAPDEILGPYSAYEMKYWKASYFENKVEVKKVDEATFRHVEIEDFEE